MSARDRARHRRGDRIDPVLPAIPVMAACGAKGTRLGFRRRRRSPSCWHRPSDLGALPPPSRADRTTPRRRGDRTRAHPTVRVLPARLGPPASGNWPKRRAVPLMDLAASCPAAWRRRLHTGLAQTYAKLEPSGTRSVLSIRRGVVRRRSRSCARGLMSETSMAGRGPSAAVDRDFTPPRGLRALAAQVVPPSPRAVRSSIAVRAPPPRRGW